MSKPPTPQEIEAETMRLAQAVKAANEKWWSIARHGSGESAECQIEKARVRLAERALDRYLEWLAG